MAYLVAGLMRLCTIALPWWVSLPVDTMALYGIFYFLFDRYVWKWSMLHRLGIVRVPDISGKWHGKVIPAGGTAATGRLTVEKDIEVTIAQTWTQIRIRGATDSSRFQSISANLLVEDERSLSYEYVNEPSVDAVATMHVHRGITRLKIDTVAGTLEGDYFSGRDRQGIGILTLRST